MPCAAFPGTRHPVFEPDQRSAARACYGSPEWSCVRKSMSRDRNGRRRPGGIGRRETSAAAQRIPKLVRFLAGHALFGGLVGCVIASAFLWLDVGGLGTLFAGERSRVALIVLYFGSFILTFASAAMGTAVMLLPKDKDPFPPA